MDKAKIQLVPLSEMAERLRLSPSDLRQDVEDGRLPAVRIGKRGLLFHAQTVERLLVERAERVDSEVNDGR